MRIGYIRVSTAEQNTARQEALMQELGVDEIYIDKTSGKNKERPVAESLLPVARFCIYIPLRREWCCFMGSR